MWLALRKDMPYFGHLFVQDWAVAIAAYGIILLHIIGAPLLMVNRTRIYVLGLYACFHTLNHFVFNIGIFPWMTLFASLLFFSPSWPRQLHTFFPKLGSGKEGAPSPEPDSSPDFSYTPRNSILFCLVLWMATQFLIPLRPWFYPGNPAWHSSGERFSWRMKLRDRHGTATFYVVSEAGRAWQIDGGMYLNHRQAWVMACTPDMILQYSKFLRNKWREERAVDVAVYADVQCSLNGREPSAYVDPRVNLANMERSLEHPEWMLPLNKPLPKTLF